MHTESGTFAWFRFNFIRSNNVVCFLQKYLLSIFAGPCVIMNGGCGQICIPTAQGPACACEHGYTLASDQKTCNRSKSPISLILPFALSKEQSILKIF